MSDRTENQALNETIFPGNTETFSRLKAVLGEEKMLAFVGAGASAPLFPTWSGLLNELIEQARARSLIHSDAETAELKGEISKDPLELARSLEDIYTKPIFR